LQRRGPTLESGFRESAETIKLAATRMNHLIEDLLDVARVEAGRLTIERSRLPAGQVASDAFAIQRVRASSAGLELRLDLPEELPEVWADRDRLLQVFDNLIGNAIKFTAAGGFITIGAASRDDHVLFWVGDMGPGIAVEDQPHLFDRFWQARSARRGGAGLGLSIVRGIVEAHGGSVWVESAPGQGSTFVFTIPVALDIDETPAEPALRSIAVRRLPRTKWPLQRSTCRSLVADGRIRKR
ncbi:MAG: sensor histidine kinase, partial [Acidobacteria bacterium]